METNKVDVRTQVTVEMIKSEMKKKPRIAMQQGTEQ